jgi:hypothetical protein
VRTQVQQLGEGARERVATLQLLLDKANGLLAQFADLPETLTEKVQRIVRMEDPNLRCALPALKDPEPLNGCYGLPPLPAQASLAAADGSQISPNRHRSVEFALVNVGSIFMSLNNSSAPQFKIESTLLYDEPLNSAESILTDERVNLERDLKERACLSLLAASCPAPVFTFTDGPIELWGAKDGNEGAFSASLDAYQANLRALCALNAATCGYVDKPGANLVTRLLEIADLDDANLRQAKKYYPLRGVSDRNLFDFLQPGERSAVFAMQSRSAQKYSDELALHFFYLNVGLPRHPWLARVEIPAWVAQDRPKLDGLHALLIQQCRVLGNRPYPYILHRAHETAVVTFDEAQQVEQMIINELYARGVVVGQASNKQATKDLPKRTRR